MQIIKKCLVWSNSAAVFLYPITFSIDADWDWSLYLISFTRIRRIIPILNTLQLSLTAVYRVQSVPVTSPHPNNLALLPKPSRHQLAVWWEQTKVWCETEDRFKKVLLEYFSQWWIVILHNDWCCGILFIHFVLSFVETFLTSLLLILFHFISAFCVMVTPLQDYKFLNKGCEIVKGFGVYPLSLWDNLDTLQRD